MTGIRRVSWFAGLIPNPFRRFEIDDEYLRIKRGLIAQNVESIDLSVVSSCEVRNSIRRFIFGVRDIHIQARGRPQIIIRSVRGYKEIQNKVYNSNGASDDNYKSKRATRTLNGEESAKGPRLNDEEIMRFGVDAEQRLTHPLAPGRERHWIINGDGTVTDLRNGNMWIQAPWGTTWDGSRFVGKAKLVSWFEAAEMFGRGTNVHGDKTYRLLTDDDFSASEYDKGYRAGSASVRYAGFTDWRLPTAAEMRTLQYTEEGDYETESKERRRIFPLLFDVDGFWSASVKWEYTGLARLTAGADHTCAWWFNFDRYSDAYATAKYGVMLVRQSGQTHFEDRTAEWTEEAVSEAHKAAMRRLELRYPFSTDELDEQWRHWQKRAPPSLAEQINRDYEILKPLAR